MAERKSHKAPPPENLDAAPSAPPVLISAYIDNMDRIHSRLAQANATLELLHLAMPDQETAEMFLDRIHWLTLNNAIYGALECVREAQAAVERIPKLEETAHG